MFEFRCPLSVLFSLSCLSYTGCSLTSDQTEMPKNELSAVESAKEAGLYGTRIIDNLDNSITQRQQRSFFKKKLGFLTAMKIGSSFPSQSSGQLIATHTGSFLGKFMNANIRLIYGSQQSLLGGGVGAVVPTVIPAKIGPEQSGGEKFTPAIILISKGSIPENATKDSSKNQPDDKMEAVESILIPVYEKLGEVKVPESILHNQSFIPSTTSITAAPSTTTTTTSTTTTEKTSMNEKITPPTSNETSTNNSSSIDKVYLIL